MAIKTWPGPRARKAGSNCEPRSCPEGERKEVECEDCSLDPLCLLLDYAGDDSGLPPGILLRRQSVARGESIFRKGDPFRSLFAVKSGSFKTLNPVPDGPDQVIGFHLPGELIGVEGVAAGSYSCTARALEPSSICELRMERLSESGRPMEILQRGIIELLGKEVAFQHTLKTPLIRQSAEQRIAAFILNMHQRLEQGGLGGKDFTLSMSRSDIGSYLGLASETVSRVMTRFQKMGLVTIQRKRVILEDPKRLAAFAESGWPTK